MESNENSAKPQTVAKFTRIFGIVAIIIVVFAAIIASLNQKVSIKDKIWDEATTVGNLDAKNYFIIYSDIVCPYCVAFENAIVEHEDEFQKYIAENDVLVEVRLSDFLYEYGQVNPVSSRYSAEAIYCAKREGKFWDYYNHTIATVWNGFFKNTGKNALTELDKKDKSYWISLGADVGLGTSFSDCVLKDETLDEVIAVAAKTVKAIDGMPYFKFNNYVSSGFDLSWGWEYVKMYFDSGLKSK